MDSPAMSKIETRDLSHGEIPGLNGLLSSDPGNLIYASRPFLDFMAEATGANVRLLLATADGRPVGALPYAMLDVPGVGCIVNSLPWWGSHGSIVLDRSTDMGNAVRRALLDAFAAQIADLDPLAWTVILLPDEETHRPLYETALRPTVMDSRIGQISILPPAGDGIEERLLGSFTQKTRNLVRKSLKQGFMELVTDTDEAWDLLHAVHRANIEVLGGRAKPRSHFATLRATIPPDMRRLSLAMDGGEPVAALLTLRFNGTVEYLTPAIMVEHRSRQPLSFLIHNAMLEAIAAGDRRWNWGGTWHGQPALHHFKSGFGAADRPYSYLINASEKGLELFRKRREELATLFPFFYVYPFDRLGAQ